LYSRLYLFCANAFVDRTKTTPALAYFLDFIFIFTPYAIFVTQKNFLGLLLIHSYLIYYIGIIIYINKALFVVDFLMETEGVRSLGYSVSDEDVKQLPPPYNMYGNNENYNTTIIYKCKSFRKVCTSGHHVSVITPWTKNDFRNKSWLVTADGCVSGLIIAPRFPLYYCYIITPRSQIFWLQGKFEVLLYRLLWQCDFDVEPLTCCYRVRISD